jgi:hypothetical protein
MMQRPIVAYLSLKGMLAREIHDDIIATLGPDAVPYSSVQLPATFARHNFLLRNQNHIQPTFKEISMIQIRLFQLLLKIVRLPRCGSSRLTHLPSTTVYRRLTESLGFVARHFRWVPHALSDAQNGERVNPSRRRLRMLEVPGDRAWHGMTLSPSTGLGFT